ncbi:MAG: hypothetical protein NTZ83_03925 [Candidatus Pacearchaeota archaeon]|nr:hypothetical protein [Candidatus Pacearchaeota archaeon]
MEELQILGLTKNESKVYTALVKLNLASVNEISRKTNVPRVNIYDILESLKSKGLVASITKSNKQFFEPANPERLNELFEQKQKEISNTKKAIQELFEEFNKNSEKKDVALFKGKLGIKSVLKDVLNSKTEIINYGSTGKFPETYKEYFDIWEDSRIRNKIKMRIVTSKSIRGKHPKKKLQEVRYLDLEFTNLTSTFIYENKVAIFTWTGDPVAILIENSELAESYRNYFESLWKTAK